MTEQNNGPATLTAEVAQIVARMRDIGRYSLGGLIADKAAEMIIALATQLSERDRRIAALTEALAFYAEGHSANPNEGPWGMASTDFGTVARAAIKNAAKANGWEV